MDNINKIEELFEFLVTDYKFSYSHQRFTNCFGNGIVHTYSYYNDNGCLTFHYLCQRGELDFYFSSQFSTEREDLIERNVDICSIEPEIWDKHQKIWIFKRPFFWYSSKRILNAFAEVLKVYLAEGNDLFSIPNSKWR